MSNPYYGGAPTAFQGGIEFSKKQRADKLRENALNALIEEYGPTAADPASAAALQGIEQSSQLHPYDVAAQERNRQAQEALIGEHGAIAGNAEAQQRDQALKLQAARRAANVLEMVKKRKGDLGQAFDMVQNVLPAIGISPDRFAEARQHIIDNPDSVDELITMLKTPTDAAKAMSGGQPFRDRTTGQLVWGTPDSSGNLIIADRNYEPATAAQAQTRLEQGARRLTNEEARMAGFDAPEGFQIWQNPDGTIVSRPIAGSQQEQTLEKGVQEADAIDNKFIKQHATASEHGQVVDTNINRALARMVGLSDEEYAALPDEQRAALFKEDSLWLQQHGVLSSNARALVAKVAGTETNEIAQAIEAVKNNISLDELQRMRQSSPTGGAMGNVSDRDMTLLQGALGRLDITRDPKILREDLMNIARIYNKIAESAQQDAEAAQQRIEARVRTPAQPPSRAPQPPPPGAAPPAGTKPKTFEDYLKQYGGAR